MLKATRRFLCGVGDVKQGLWLWVVDTTNLHGLKEDTIILPTLSA